MARAERFSRFNAIGRMSRSTVLLSITMRPSVRNGFKPPHYLTMYFCASPVGDLAETCVRLGVLLTVQRDQCVTLLARAQFDRGCQCRAINHQTGICQRFVINFCTIFCNQAFSLFA